MTREEAIRILDPETAVETLSKIEYYGGFRGRAKAAQALYDTCILAVSALREQEERRWIPVTERLPDIGKDVLIYSKEDGADVDYYGGDMFGYWNVTHWMPLPEPPKEGV